MYTIFSEATGASLHLLMNNVKVSCIDDEQEILKVLTESKTQGNTVGINAPCFGNTILITAIDEIIFDDEVMIVLKPYDVSGRILERNKLSLSEVKSIVPFKSTFTNPYLKTINNGSAEGLPLQSSME